LDKDDKLNGDVIARFAPHEAFKCPTIAIGKVHGLPLFGLDWAARLGLQYTIVMCFMVKRILGNKKRPLSRSAWNVETAF
jgi:hypothetical protein